MQPWIMDTPQSIPHWHAPFLTINRLRGPVITSPTRPFRSRKARRKLFRLIKERGKATTRKVREELEESGNDFYGFCEVQLENQRYHRGFSDSEVSAAFHHFVLLQNFIIDNFLEVPLSHPVSCLSIPLQPRANDCHYNFHVIPWVQRRIRCLSLFDGISSGLHVLQDKLHLDVEAYFASEIEESALAVQRKNFYGKIVNLGDVRNISTDMLNCLGRIDLLIGGSPCNELSRVNYRRKGLLDTSGSGPLFFKYVEIRNFLQAKANASQTQFYWMFENTAHMDVNTRQTITEYLQCLPVQQCPSTCHVPMKRKRFFFGNVPRVSSCGDQPTKPPPLRSFFKPYRVPAFSTLPTLTTSSLLLRSGPSKELPMTELGRKTGLSVTEVELLMGLPSHFTDTGNLSPTSRLKLLGRSWSIPVVTDILANLSFMYKRVGSD